MFSRYIDSHVPLIFTFGPF